MKLAIDCRMIGSGGIGSYLSALLPFFLENYECTLLGTKEQLSKFQGKANTELVSCNVPTFSLKEMFNFPKAVSKKINECDIFYSPYCNIPSGIKIPIYSTIHDVVFLDVEGLASKSGTLIRKFFYLYACKKSKVIFTVSEFSKERILHHLKTKKPVIVTYNAVPDWFFDNIDSAPCEKEDKILFVGNIKKHKGLSVLLDAFSTSKEKGLTSKLLIVGNKDNFRTQDEAVFRKINAITDNSVEFTGKISDAELKHLYKTSKLLIQPSFYEGFGMPPMEAMSLGCHVVMSDIPVFKEIYRNFPVTYFRTGDSADLSEKIIQAEKSSLERIAIPDIYSFEKTFGIIKNTLETK